MALSTIDELTLQRIDKSIGGCAVRTRIHVAADRVRRGSGWHAFQNHAVVRGDEYPPLILENPPCSYPNIRLWPLTSPTGFLR